VRVFKPAKAAKLGVFFAASGNAERFFTSLRQAEQLQAA